MLNSRYVLLNRFPISAAVRGDSPLFGSRRNLAKLDTDLSGNLSLCEIFFLDLLNENPFFSLFWGLLGISTLKRPTARFVFKTKK